MRFNFRNLVAVFIGFFLAVTISTCSLEHIKLIPEYQGVDPRAEPQLKEYKDLAKKWGITFKKDVTIGFKTINEGNAVGICNYGANWREIDIDIDYWNNSSTLKKSFLLWHELTHCYCDRDHDYEDGKKYPENEDERIEEVKKWIPGTAPPGRYRDDFCPLSLMYPVVLEQDCILAHYQDYVAEMFNRCTPW